jgi:hypothetical protein
MEKGRPRGKKKAHRQECRFAEVWTPKGAKLPLLLCYRGLPSSPLTEEREKRRKEREEKERKEKEDGATHDQAQ